MYNCLKQTKYAKDTHYHDFQNFNIWKIQNVQDTTSLTMKMGKINNKLNQLIKL